MQKRDLLIMVNRQNVKECSNSTFQQTSKTKQKEKERKEKWRVEEWG